MLSHNTHSITSVCCTVFIWKDKGEGTLGRPRYRWEVVRMDLEEIENEGSTGSAAVGWANFYDYSNEL